MIMSLLIAPDSQMYKNQASYHKRFNKNCKSTHAYPLIAAKQPYSYKTKPESCLHIREDKPFPQQQLMPQVLRAELESHG